MKLNNGVIMPNLGLGTFLMTNEEALEIIPKALAVGYRHIDTAQMYGNEEAIGKALKTVDLKREEYFITTKLMPKYLGYEGAIREINNSLEKLDLDYIDLILIHWPSQDYAVNSETWRAFEELYEAKKVRAIGVSNFNIHHMDALLKTAKIKPMVNQIEMHPGLQQATQLKYLTSHNIKMISYGPFMRGEVFNKEGRYYQVLKEIADKYQKTVAQIIIAWGLQRGIFMIPKTKTVSRLEENFLGDQIILTDDEMTKIALLNRGKKVYTDPDNFTFYD